MNKEQYLQSAQGVCDVCYKHEEPCSIAEAHQFLKGENGFYHLYRLLEEMPPRDCRVIVTCFIEANILDAAIQDKVDYLRVMLELSTVERTERAIRFFERNY